jgi:hypothetical protein
MGKLDTKRLVSEMANLSLDDLICGPGTQCAIDKENDLLEQKYLNAQSNFESAPLQLTDAKRAYQLATLGDVAANDIIENGYTEEANSNVQQLDGEFQKNLEYAKEINDTLESSVNNEAHTDELIEKYTQENEEIRLELKKNISDVVTSDRKTYYEDDQYNNIQKWTKLWNIIYYILVLLFAIMILMEKSCYSFIVKLLIMSTIILYKNFIYLTNIWMFWIITLATIGLLIYLFKQPDGCKEDVYSFGWLIFAYYFPPLLNNVFLKIILAVLDLCRLLISYLPKNVYLNQ